MVKDSKLEISPKLLVKQHKPNRTKEEIKQDAQDPFNNLANGVFIPTVSKSNRNLLYVRFTFKGIEKIVIYDHTYTSQLVIPDDVI